MNIGIVTTWFERGAAYVSRQIMDVLVSEHRVFIYARGEKYDVGNPNWDDENVHWGKRIDLPGAGRIAKQDFFQWMKNNHIDIVIFNEQLWWKPVIWVKEYGLITGCYIDYYTKKEIPYFAIYDFLICNTKRHYSVFNWHKECYYVPWGTDVNIYQPSQSKQNKTLKFFHSSGYNSFRKGTDLLIKAFNCIKEGRDIELIIHTQKDISQLIQDDNKIRVIHRTVNAPGLYHLGDVYVYPSRLDGIGLTVCEALSCGLPVITTNSQPMSEFIIEENNGILVDIEKVYKRKDNYYWPMTEVSVDDLAKKMLYYYENKKLLDKYKKNAREYVCLERDWKKNAHILLNIMNDSILHPFPRQLKTQINKHDLSGWGMLNEILSYVPPVRLSMSFLYRLYRTFRQPHFFKVWSNKD